MPRSARNLQQTTVVITGASAGVGRAVALRFARAGANFALIARDAAALGAEKLGTTALAPVWEIAPHEFRRATEVTYLGMVHGTMAALRHMRPRNRGTIVQVGSALAYRGIPLQSAYCGAKHALRGFTNSLRTELEHGNSAIAVTIVELPAVNTPQFDWARTYMPRRPRPVPPVVQPEAVADKIFRAAFDPKREYWLGASTFEAILGDDRYLARNAYQAQETATAV